MLCGKCLPLAHQYVTSLIFLLFFFFFFERCLYYSFPNIHDHHAKRQSNILSGNCFLCVRFLSDRCTLASLCG